MDKILSICIPSYNMEGYLNRCIDSLLSPESIDFLEIIIVNDGSKDRTLEIAGSYKEKYPHSVVVVDKPNGHYGSCINAALKIASGKYFKILDADDWYDTKALAEVVNVMRTIDVDCVFTRYSVLKIRNKRKAKIVEQKSGGIVYNKELSLDQYNIPEQCLGMHGLSYKLEFLKRICYVQTEGICYTDTEYVFFPLIAAETLFCINTSLYQYYIGREGQSVSLESMAKNRTHFEIILNRIIKSHDQLGLNKNNIQTIRTHYYTFLMRNILRCILVGEKNENNYPYIKHLLCQIKSLSYKSYTEILDTKYHGIPYVKLWIKDNMTGSFVLKMLQRLIRLMHSC